MRIGYSQLNQKGATGSEEERPLKEANCEVIYLERYSARKQDWRRRPQLERVFSRLRSGDSLVVSDLDQLSSHSYVWLEVIQELKLREVQLEILDYPLMALSDWQQLMNWVKASVEQKESRITVTKFRKERRAEKRQFSCFSRDPHIRRAYWTIFQQVAGKRSLRQISKESGESLSTVVRIRHEYRKLRQAAFLIVTFFLTIVSLKLSQTYSSNVLLQVVICGGMTSLIIYFTYSDHSSE